MGRIVVSENVTLDGVIEDPTGDEGFEHGGWLGRIGDRGREAADQLLLEEVTGADALLLGRRSYEFLAARWPSRIGPLADRLNRLPKHVASSTLTNPQWQNTTVLAGDLAQAVATLREDLAGDVVVPASGELVRLLFDRGLVDELRLMVHPVALGTGRRLFDGFGASLSLDQVLTVGDNMIRLTFRLARD